jgi:hypothetical protein
MDLQQYCGVEGAAVIGIGLEGEISTTEEITLGDLLGPPTEISGGYYGEVEIQVPGHHVPRDLIGDIFVNGLPEGTNVSATGGIGGGVFIGHNHTTDLVQAIISLFSNPPPCGRERLR